MNRNETLVTITESCGNIFADLGLPDAEEHMAKAKIVNRIDDIIRERRLTQAQAAKMMGLDQPKVSALLRGRFSGYSLDRLIRLLNLMDQDVEIIIREKPPQHPMGHMCVTFG